jgi:threonine dehydrogenase-like Zn-dependent dehydrogenase
VTHRFTLNDVVPAYETFQNAAQTQALKVMLSR